MLWCIDSDSSNKEDYLNIEKKKKCKSYFKRNSTFSVYTLSRDQSFFHWIFEWSTFSLCRCKSLDFIDDLFILFSNKVRNLSILSYSNILEYENFINRYIYIFLLGGISAFDELQFDTGELRHLSEQFLKSSQGSAVPYIVGLAEYLASTISIISSSLELFFERFSKNTFITKSADVIPIWQRNSAIRSPVNSHQYTFTNSTVPNTEPLVSNLTFDDLSYGSWVSLVDTTLSILKDVTSLFLLFYI